MLFYLAIGCILAAVVVYCIKKTSLLSYIKKHRKFFYVLLAIAVVFLLARIGQINLAAIFGVFSAIIIFLNRIINFISLAKYFKNFPGLFSKTKSAGRYNNNNMTVAEACEILGVKANASKEEINNAYKKLMQRNHPDKGGSKYFAEKLNAARTTLLKKK